ncbi:hypothetical protein AB0C12_29650 [Actinoplanes sp. NPDC048967]|uniref:hypothetical protein n=1 Tax=Actinoplanes sp. NPDC048967 TaxID=3155269 RepID=UPI0033DA5553
MGLSRRSILAVAVTGTAAALVVTGAVAAGASQRKPAPRPVTAASASAAAPDPAPRPAERQLGEVVDAGYRAKDGAWVIYAVAIEEKALPGTRFGVMAGLRRGDGKVTGIVVANETDGSDRAPGFHAVQGGMEVDGRPSPSFGYYAGAAAKITARIGGRTVTARQAAWSADNTVKFFWFDPAAGMVSDLKAYDSKGRALPAGHNSVGVG